MADPPLPPEPVACLEAPPGQEFAVTRENLSNGSLLARIRADAPAGMTFRSEAEVEANMTATLAAQPSGQDVWLFGYGSLMWNPVINYAERRVATIHGFHRSYCLWLLLGRGSPEHPGLMLALDRGGSCQGVAFRIPAATAREELRLVWQREMVGGAYQPRWVGARTPGGPIRAITFVVDRGYPRYAGKLDDGEIARRVATASGIIGSCAAYLADTIAALRALGMRDRMLERIARKVAEGANGAVG